jgi:Fur family ferric uptake transcriptional regulator
VGKTVTPPTPSLRVEHDREHLNRRHGWVVAAILRHVERMPRFPAASDSRLAVLSEHRSHDRRLVILVHALRHRSIETSARDLGDREIQALRPSSLECEIQILSGQPHLEASVKAGAVSIARRWSSPTVSPVAAPPMGSRDLCSGRSRYRLTTSWRASTATEALLSSDHCSRSIRSDTRATRRRAPDVLSYQAREPQDAQVVYRTLDELARLGLVHHVYLGERLGAWHLTIDDEHHHLVCEGCGRAEAIPTSELAPMLDVIVSKYGFRPYAHHFALLGYCADCRPFDFSE